MLGRHLRMPDVGIDVGSRCGFPGWPCPANPSSALDPPGRELAAQPGFSVTRTRDIIGATLLGGGFLAIGQPLEWAMETETRDG